MIMFQLNCFNENNLQLNNTVQIKCCINMLGINNEQNNNCGTGH